MSELTRERINALLPCPKTDVLVAEARGQTVEWRWCHQEPECGTWVEHESLYSPDKLTKENEHYREHNNLVKLACMLDPQAEAWWYPVSPVSTDLSACEVLLDEMKAAGSIRLDWNGFSRMWKCSGFYERACDTTLEMGIVKLWLLWKMQKGG